MMPGADYQLSAVCKKMGRAGRLITYPIDLGECGHSSKGI
jgi:hypothetical protein